MHVSYPVTSSLLTEARLYCQDSIQHTMDYEGWDDQHEKQARITYGKFGQLWVAEFCRLNGIPHSKDRSSPKYADDLDLMIHNKRVDVKTTVYKDLVGQISPGVINKDCDEYCFVVTDKQCTFVTPIGFVSKQEYKEHCIFVKQGEVIPGTTLTQRFRGGSYFIQANTKVLRPFVMALCRGNGNMETNRVEFPTLLVEATEIQECIDRISALEQSIVSRDSLNNEILQMLMENNRLLVQLSKGKTNTIRRCNVVAINGSLFDQHEDAA